MGSRIPPGRGINAAEKEMDPPPHTIKGAQKSPAEVLMKKLKENMEQQKERKITLPAPLFINGLVERVAAELGELTGWAERNAALFETLHGINGDICGWITIDGTPIDYPVLRGETNDDYNRTSYNGSYSVGGSIFMDVGNAEDFSDMHTSCMGTTWRTAPCSKACTSTWTARSEISTPMCISTCRTGDWSMRSFPPRARCGGTHCRTPDTRRGKNTWRS